MLKGLDHKELTSSFLRQFSSFTYLNMTQFLGALNDNIYKLLIVFQFIYLEGMEASHSILATTGAIFVLPFLLFSASSGVLADRFNKRHIILIIKILELATMLVGVLAFAYHSKWGSYIILFLLATQSAVFGPSKYGILPELVSSDKISKANGLMSSFTFLAIIMGTFSATFLLDITGNNFIISSLCCCAIAFIGVITSYCIRYTPPNEPAKSLSLETPLKMVGGAALLLALGALLPHFLVPYLLFAGIAAVVIFNGIKISKSLKIASQQPSLLITIFGSAFFLFLAAFVQLNVIPFAVESLNLKPEQGTYLFLITAIGIGTGSLIAGKVSGRTVELGLVPIAGLGVTICCYLLDVFSSELYVVIPVIVLLGLFGGMYQIPLDTYIQVTSPSKSRGQIVGATNVLSFIGVLTANGLLMLISQVGLSADKGFVIIGSMALIVTLVIGFQFFDYLTRFIGMIFARIHFKTQFNGASNIPDTPAVYVCSHTAWNDTLLVLGSQRRRVRFFIEQEQDHSRWMRRIYRLLRVVSITSIEPMENNPVCLNVIRRTLKKGFSVCIFVNNENICEEIEKLKHSFAFRAILEENHYPMIPVSIEKGEKNSQSRFFTRLMKKFRVPACVSFGSKINDPLPQPLDENDPDLCSNYC